LSVSGLSNNLQIVNNEHFFQQIARLNQCLNEIDVLIRQMLQVQETILCRPIAEPEDKHQLDFIINQIRKLIGELRNNLRQLESEQQKEISLNINISNATRRINLNQIEQLKRRLYKILENFHKAREDYRQRISSKILNFFKF
jgi:translation initiation factor 2B subunit (eIF-2B alpha/beta/delta family)